MTYKRLLSKTISVKLSFLLLLQQSIIAGEIVSDVTANSSFQATVEKSQNGIPVVNIVAPNEQGLSHNKFSDYNVNKEGAILNNSNKREVNTQLAGYIYGNNNLAGRNTANTILNEVTSRNKTELKGFTEVAGDRANVIIANPNGVYINGAGFINTQKATITTGAVNLQNGSVNNYRVDKGEIQIDGDGLNTSNVDKAELYSKVVKINAKIHAQDLDIVTGKNDILNDGSVKKIEELDNEKPEVSIDSSNLGGIYANKISLVGTQDGVGINLPIEITAQDDFKLSTDGKITLDKVVSNKDLEIKSTSNDVSSNIIYANNVNVEVKNEIKNKDIIASKKDINLKATKIVNENLIASGVNEDLKDSTNGNININSQNLENKKTLYAKDNININSKSIENENGIIKVNKNLQINTSDFKGDNSKLEASNIDIKADNFEANNSKIIAIAGDINLNSKDLSLNSSLLSASEYLDINTEYLKNISGYIQALNNINIISKNLDNSNGTIVTNENLNISSINGTFINQNGILQSNKNLQLDILNFKGDNSKLEASNIDIKADILEAKNSNIVATNGNLDIKTNSLNLDNSVQIASMKNLSITSNESKLNNSKILSQNGNIILNSKDLELNSSNVTSLEKMDIKSDSLKSKNGNIQALKDINITSKIIDNQNGVIITNENLTIKSQKDGFFNNTKGILQSNKNLQINTSDFKGDNSKLQASNIDIKADNFEAKDLSAIATDNNLILESNSSILENSYLQAKNNLNLNSNSLNLKDNMIISTNLNLNANEINLDGTSQTKNILLSTNDIFINSKKLISNYLFAQSNNDININSSNIDLKNSKFQSVAFKGDINLITSNLNLYNTALASKDINLKNEANEEIINLIIESSSLDVNNDINMATLNLSSKNSKYLASNNLELNTNRSVVFLNNSFSANNINLSVNEDLILDKTNSLEAQNTLILNTKSLVNNAQFISNGDLTINTSDFIVNNSLLNAKNALKLNATNYILNNDSNELIFGIRAAYTNLNTKLLTNNGFISSLYDMNIKVDDLINYGGIASANGENKASNMNIEAINVTNYNTIYSNDNINLYVKNSLLNETNKNKVNLGNEKATIFATNNIVIQGNEDKSLRTNEIINQSANIETQNGDINIFANNFINKRSQNYEDLYEYFVFNEDYRYIPKYNIFGEEEFETKKEYDEMIKEKYPRVKDISHSGGDSHYYVYYPEYDLKVYLNRVYYSGNEGMSVSIKETQEKEKLTSLNSTLYAGNFIYINTNKLTNEISNIGSKKDIYFINQNMNLINKELNFNAQLDFFTNVGNHDGDGYHDFYKLNSGEFLVRSNTSTPAYTYYYQNKIINSTIQAGGIITGNINKLQNGISEGKVIDYSVYSPTTNTSVKTANVQTDKKETENKNIEERDKSSIKVKNEDLNSNDLENIIVLNPIDETFQLPTNKYSMFTTVNPNKNLNYLVESNPLYTNYSNFIGSSYFLEKMNYQGDRITKRLGDAGYETKLISDSIFKQTGQRFLGNYTSENAQFVALMDSAINLSGILGLEVGKSLTPEQLASLTEDIVWMEEKVVAGQIVLAPVVYLAGDYNKAQGAIIQAKNIDLEIKENLVNSGTIKTDEYLNINANSIVNNSGVILSDGKATLISNDDFVNKNGGLIKASDIQIASLNGSVINETYSKTNTITQGKNDITYTNIGKTSSIEATNGNVVIQAKDNITNIGANLIAKDNLLLQTQNGDVNLQAIKLENGHNLYFNGGFDKAKDVEYQTSNVKANNVVINSGNNINLEASKLNADNQINLNAINDVNILALNNVHYTDVQTSKKGTFSKKTQRDMVYKETVNSSELNANDIVINANNNVNLEASKLKAQDNIIVNSKEADVNILAKEYKEGEIHHTSKSSFGGLKKSLDIKSSDSLKLNSALLETQAANVVITSGKDINILASEINSGNLLLADAKNNLNILSDEEILKQEEIHKKTSFSPSFSGNMLVLAQEKTTSDKNATTTQISSNLSGKEVVLQAQNEMNIIGSNVIADDVILKANDINLLSATQSASNEHLESTKKIGIEVTLNTKEASIFAGGITNKDEINKGNTTQLASNILGDNVTLISKDSTNVLASNILANNDLIIAGGKNINILSGEVTDYKDEIHTYLKAGVSLGVKQNVTDGVKNIVNTTENIAKSDNVANAGFGALKLVDTISNTLSNPVSAGLNAVAISNKSTSSTTNQGVESSNIYAGNNAIFDAGEDINIKGSNVYVKNDFDIYAKNLNIEAAKETSNSKTTDKNMDLSVGLYGTNAGKVDVSLAQEKQTAQSTNYVNSNIQAGNLNLNVSNDVKIEGANIKAKDVLANIGNNLTLASLQNTSNSNGSNQSLSVGTSGSLGVGTGKNESQRDWVDNQTTFIGTNSMKVNVGGTTTIKGAVLANADYVDGKLVDNNNLKLNTTNLITQNIYDKNDSNSYNLSLGVSKTQKETQGKMELGLSDSSKEQINYATIGQGEITTNSDITNVNRDVTNSQVVTKDESNNLNIYLSNTSIDKALNPNQTVAKWTQDWKDMGLNVRNEIISNLPSATKLDKDGNGNVFDKTIGKALDYDPYGIGIVPSVANGGGYITQIATQLFGDNRTGVVVENKDVLIKAGVSEDDIEEVTLVKTKDGIKRAEDVKSTDKILDTVTVYRTDPNKTIIISENQASIDKEKSLSDYNSSKIYLTQDDVKNSGITHLFTNGMFNPFDTAIYNQQTQQSNANGILNYN